MTEYCSTTESPSGIFWGPGSWDFPALGTWSPNFMYENVATPSHSEQTVLSLATGGPLGSTQQNLWCIKATGTDEHFQPIPPEEISVGALGKLGSDGKLYVVLPDNDANNVTLRVGVTQYDFSVDGARISSVMKANDVTLDPECLVYGAEFCVGQRVTLSVAVDLPEGATIVGCHWAGIDGAVNKTCLPAAPKSSTDYLFDSPLLYGNSASVWFTNEFACKIVSCEITIRFGNGQTLCIKKEGCISIYSPKMTLFTPIPPFTPMIHNRWLELGNEETMTGTMRFNAHLESKGKFWGSINWCQLLNRNTTFTTSTGGAYWLDTGPFYNTVKQNGADVPNNVRLVPNPSAPTAPPRASVSFMDNPGTGTSFAYVNCTDLFKTYLVFRPDPEDTSIWVTLGIVNWGWSGTEISGFLTSPSVTSPTFTPSSEFPIWTNIIYGKGN